MTQLLANKKNGIYTAVDEADVPLLKGWRISVMYQRGDRSTAYARVSKDGENLSLARFLTGAPKGMVVDHINGDTLDNRRSNLRICTPAQNSFNRGAHGAASKFRGVTWGPRQKRWRAAIQKDRKQYHIGYFVNEEDAARAWDARARELHGEYARLNFPAA